MQIIQKQPNPGGAYPPIQDTSYLPEDCVEISSEIDITEFYKYNGFVRLEIKDNKVTKITPNIEAWEAWKTVPIKELREQALQRISGKCSATIEYGLDIGDKHYSFSPLAQTDIAGCMQELRNGASVVPYRADGEVDYSPYNLEQMTAVYTAMSEWIKVNTQYKATLEKWIAREGNKDVLNSINYGIMLPDDLLQELGKQLTVYGVDIKKYASMLTQKQEGHNENK